MSRVAICKVSTVGTAATELDDVTGGTSSISVQHTLDHDHAFLARSREQISQPDPTYIIASLFKSQQHSIEESFG